jgi:tetratricopeptide (TPR) repeat protein
MAFVGLMFRCALPFLSNRTPVSPPSIKSAAADHDPAAPKVARYSRLDSGGVSRSIVREVTMAGEIKREDAGRINKKLHECRANLQKENVYSCLVGFREVLERLRMTRMLPADEKQLHQDINAFQYDLSASRAFRHLYGPVTFMDDNFETSLDFMKQLIQIKEEEILEESKRAENDRGSGEEPGGVQARVQELMMLVEKGDFATAREKAEKDEEAADILIERYNTAGIQYRKEKDFEKAVKTFKKAVFIRPDDEGLYYNMTRSFIDAGDWKSAKDTIEEGLKTHPGFEEGVRLLAFVHKNYNF